MTIKGEDIVNHVSFRLDEKVALVTGASRGIGKALAEGSNHKAFQKSITN
ncbi:hypothetical protein MUO14_07755 [Halobacillus shinanisalinarum]|uniref:SDR family NAD(P)-dependent oxidoreductase n=1 Tax=Halobacillus shinanisalinarum TaxID=2932258 RepID=A0ABY4H3X4_9BACI|nr:hypothetical protein [Halobacillus shinanisalinarum]UOQ94815.1 hypothetical protein MUO14_07755 [Halobacillus shinanisalinarum]